MSHTSRRQFAKALAAAGAAVPLSALAQTPSTSATAMTEVVRAQYGAHLNADDVASIARNFERSAAVIDRLRAVKLVNADEPDFTFAALVRRW